MICSIEQELIEIEESGVKIPIIERLLAIKDFYEIVDVLDYKISHQPSKINFITPDSIFEELSNCLGENPDRVEIMFQSRIEFMNFIEIVNDEMNQFPDHWFHVECTLLKRNTNQLSWSLLKENIHLNKSRDKWRELSKEFLHYTKSYEKAIETASNEGYDKATIDRINALYEQFEKEKDVVE